MTEIDPNGIDQHAPGAKLDNGKAYAAQILGMFSRALAAVAEVGTFGANKYTMGGWQHVPGGLTRYEDAQMRHWLKRNSGEFLDPDSGLLHRAHEAWNVLAQLELYLRTEELSACEDTDPPPVYWDGGDNATTGLLWSGGPIAVRDEDSTGLPLDLTMIGPVGETLPDCVTGPREVRRWEPHP